MSKKVITFIGGGNGTHVGASLCGINKLLEVRILTRSPKYWKKKLSLTLPNNKIVGSKISKISYDPKNIIPGSDIVIVSSPISAYSEIFNKVVPYLDSNTIIGTLFSQAHVDAIIKKALVRNNKVSKNITLFGIQYIPWQSKTIKYGEKSHLVGQKSIVELAVYPEREYMKVQSTIEDIFNIPCIQTPFIATTLTTSNQILHPARYFSAFGLQQWDGKTPFINKNWGPGSLYTEMDHISAALLGDMNDEIMNIKDSLKNKFPDINLSRIIPCKDRIKEHYGDQVDDYSTLKSTFNTAKMYRKSKFAMKDVEGGVIPDVNHRHFMDDIPYGLCAVKDVAQRLGVKVPIIDHMIYWHQTIMGKSFVTGPDYSYLDGTDLCETGCLSQFGYSDGIQGLEEYIRGEFNIDNNYEPCKEYNEIIHKPSVIYEPPLRLGPLYYKKSIMNKHNKLPVICFDIDKTLWKLNVEEFEHTDFSRKELELYLFKDVKDILEWAKNEEFKLVLASRTWNPEKVKIYLQRININQYFDNQQIYPTGLGKHMNSNYPKNKLLHFYKITEEMGISYNELIFFDNEINNCRFANELGITSIHVPDGLNWKKLNEGLKQYMNK